MFRFIVDNIKAKDISLGTKILTRATAIRWIGWGFAENLVPVFLFSFASSYAEAGLLKSSLEISMILTMPIIGLFADRMKATTLILLGLFIYIFTGVSYLFAGITGLAIFIIVARITNGIGYGLDAIGRETYFRRNNPSSKLASVFGYFDSISIFWWISASIVGIFLVKYFSIHWLLFMITPTVLISIWMIWNWRKKNNEVVVKPINPKLDFKEIFKELGTWNYQLRMIMVLNLILSASWSTILFFLPIDMYKDGAGYTMIILFGIAATIPVLFGIFFGRIFDKRGPRVFVYGLLVYGFLLLMLAFGETYLMIIITAFLIGIIQEFIYVGKEALVTIYSKPENFGKVGGFMRSIVNIGAMIGPLIAGVVIDSTGSMKLIFAVLSVCMIMLSLAFAVHGRIRHIQKKRMNVAIR